MNINESTSIQPLKEFIYIECADGKTLPHLGYIEAELMIENGLQTSQTQTCLFLVAPDSRYSATTPVVLGTNILSELLQECKNNAGERFLQNAKLHVPWYFCFRTMVLREKNLSKCKNRLAVVRCAMTHKVTLAPNRSVSIMAYTDKGIDHPETTAMFQETEDAAIPAYIDVTPGIISYKYN